MFSHDATTKACLATFSCAPNLGCSLACIFEIAHVCESQIKFFMEKWDTYFVKFHELCLHTLFEFFVQQKQWGWDKLKWHFNCHWGWHNLHQFPHTEQWHIPQKTHQREAYGASSESAGSNWLQCNQVSSAQSLLQNELYSSQGPGVSGMLLVNGLTRHCIGMDGTMVAYLCRWSNLFSCNLYLCIIYYEFRMEKCTQAKLSYQSLHDFSILHTNPTACFHTSNDGSFFFSYSHQGNHSHCPHLSTRTCLHSEG